MKQKRSEQKLSFINDKMNQSLFKSYDHKQTNPHFEILINCSMNLLKKQPTGLYYYARNAVEYTYFCRLMFVYIYLHNLYLTQKPVKKIEIELNIITKYKK